MECSVQLRPSWWAPWLALPVIVAATGVLLWKGFPGVASVLLLATAVDGAIFFHRQTHLPRAVFVQGMRWWLVSREGELQGPWWLAGNSRRGTLWIALRLEGGGGRHRRRTLWIQRDMVSPVGWSRLHWEMLRQASRRERANAPQNRRFGALARRIMATARNRLWRRWIRDNPG